MSFPLRAGGILAAGEGSRLKRDGWKLPKPLVPVAGVPLLEQVLSNFAAAGVTSIAMIFNEGERECERFARERFPHLDLRIVIRTTASSLESFRTIAPLLLPGPALVSTVDAWCPRSDFLGFIQAAAQFAGDETALAVTPFVEDERPLWVSVDSSGRVTKVGGRSGDGVTAGLYVFPQRVLRLDPSSRLGRLREFLGWLVESGERVRAISIAKVVDVDRAVDIAEAEALAKSSGLRTRDVGRVASHGSSPESRVPSPELGDRRCWGIYRELAHSPGRESDDALILQATASQLSRRGFEVELKTPEELPQTDDAAGIPPLLFVMCEQEAVVRRLLAWERQGVRVVNRPAAIRNTDRERTISRFCGDGVPFPKSILVSTSLPPSDRQISTPCWVKRGDVHATCGEDVRFASRTEEVAAELAQMRARGISRAVIQEHVPGDLIKFYGVGGNDENGAPLSWFQWFYHRDQRLAHHLFDPNRLRQEVARAAAALGLEIFGGDAIATADGRTALIDLNAWPSFALYRETAAEKIASRLAERFWLPTRSSRPSAGSPWPEP